MFVYAIPEVALIVALVALFGWHGIEILFLTVVYGFAALFVCGVAYTLGSAAYYLWHADFYTAGSYVLGLVAVCVIAIVIIAPLTDWDDD